MNAPIQTAGIPSKNRLHFRLNVPMGQRLGARFWGSPADFEALCSKFVPPSLHQRVHLLALDGSPGETHYSAEVRAAAQAQLHVHLLESLCPLQSAWNLPISLLPFDVGDEVYPLDRAQIDLDAIARRFGEAGYLLVQLPHVLGGPPVYWYAANPIAIRVDRVGEAFWGYPSP